MTLRIRPATFSTVQSQIFSNLKIPQAQMSMDQNVRLQWKEQVRNCMVVLGSESLIPKNVASIQKSLPYHFPTSFLLTYKPHNDDYRTHC
jgi:hypothetical protein